jgi:hypothetical protein
VKHDLLRHLERGQIREHLKDLGLHVTHDSGVGGEFARGFPLDPLLARPCLESPKLRHDEQGAVRTTVPDQNRLFNELVRFQAILNRLRGHVLSASRHQQILLPIRNLEESVGIDLADVTGGEPTLGIDHLTGSLMT